MFECGCEIGGVFDCFVMCVECMCICGEIWICEFCVVYVVWVVMFLMYVDCVEMIVVDDDCDDV